VQHGESEDRCVLSGNNSSFVEVVHAMYEMARSKQLSGLSRPGTCRCNELENPMRESPPAYLFVHNVPLHASCRPIFQPHLPGALYSVKSLWR